MHRIEVLSFVSIFFSSFFLLFFFPKRRHLKKLAQKCWLVSAQDSGKPTQPNVEIGLPDLEYF